MRCSWTKIHDLTMSPTLNSPSSLVYRYAGVEAESWIIAAKHVRIMNLCFKNLGIMNLCTSARESWITRLWEKLNKIHVWINCVRSRECRIWRFRESNFQKFFRGTCPRPPYIIRAFGADSPLVSPIVQLQKPPCQDKTNDDIKSEWSRSLNTK